MSQGLKPLSCLSCNARAKARTHLRDNNKSVVVDPSDTTYPLRQANTWPAIDRSKLAVDGIFINNTNRFVNK
ncbi:hypothetical protein AciX8_0858 [Granulicella mallensis MP5ACTX8]|uniref:Uncharacterized protein n=1 Tax=Granulicella mallensis (strain ATCC BAA-1857 / DSM 23137 / MP5ACTX8) TaxID=682795 RepID=G8NTH5_GRAMM|nr:hypothetical protein AciX8_0858 [Granulicella mallensis MP5ACTX8]